MIGRTQQRSKPKVITAGVDSALQRTGVCVHDGTFDLQLVRGQKLRGAARLDHIAREVLAIILPRKPALVAIEGYSMYSTGRWFDLGEIGGLLKVELYRADIPVLVVPPSVLKCFVADNGLATKDRIKKDMLQVYGVATNSSDLADAAGLARLAYVYLTGDSQRRCELEAVRTLHEMNENPRKRPREKTCLGGRL